MVESGNVVWNITEIGGQDGYRVTQMGLAEPIDAKIVDRSKFQPQAQMSHVFSPSCYSTVIAYRPDAFPNGAPKSWADFWDVKAFPGPRSLRNHPVDNLEAALMADGVAPDKLYPLDVDRAFKKLDAIHKHINVWWTTGQQPAQLLVDKEVVLATGWNGRFYDLIRKEAPLAMEWNGGILKQGSWVVPKGAKDQYWSMKVLGDDERSQAPGRECRGSRLFRHAPRLQPVRGREDPAAAAALSRQPQEAALARPGMVDQERRGNGRALEQMDAVQGVISAATATAAAQTGRSQSLTRPHEQRSGSAVRQRKRAAWTSKGRARASARWRRSPT